MGINPFIVQCLAVGSLLIHRINKKDRFDLKGRIAQIATGEGKSINISILSWKRLLKAQNSFFYSLWIELKPFS